MACISRFVKYICSIPLKCFNLQVDTARYPLITVLIRAVTTVVRVLMNVATDGVSARQGSMAPVVK